MRQDIWSYKPADNREFPVSERAPCYPQENGSFFSPKIRGMDGGQYAVKGANQRKIITRERETRLWYFDRLLDRR